MNSLKKIKISKEVKRVIIYLLIAYFLPWFALFYAVCGILDVARNGKGIDKELLYQYFLGAGTFTWFFSPFNLILDLFGLPYLNRGISNYEHFPKRYQKEIDQVIEEMKSNDLVEKLQPVLSGEAREMIFFKWYNKNIDNSIHVPEFHKDYKYIKTIGISVFNKKATTSRHFGPFRASYRILFNIKPLKSEEVYIDCCNQRHYFHQKPMYIFDDTLMHQSVNGSDEPRYCAFIDITRPSLLPWIMDGAIYLIGFGFGKIKKKLYRSWKFI